jgi:hypothetical protein
MYLVSEPQSTYKGRVEMEGMVIALSAGAYTTTLYLIVDAVKWNGVGVVFSLQIGDLFFLNLEIRK